MIYCFLASGFEEMEAFCPIDILRRGGCEVLTVGIGKEIVSGSHGITVAVDITDSEIKLDNSVEMIILPGGMPGTLNLEKSEAVQNAIDYCSQNNKYIASICAAPSILGHKGLLKNHKAICFPGFESQLDCEEISDDFVCVSGKFITAKGAGAALEFGLCLLETLKGQESALKMKEALQCR